MKIYSREQILAAFDVARAVSLVRHGFIAYSQGRVQQPPVQNFQFPAVAGECCVKSAYVEGMPYFVVKLSTGFYNNPAHGLSSNNGLSVVVSAHSGLPLALLDDEGWLTSLRTAIAGRIGAELMAPREVHAIGVIGAGIQARLQLRYLKAVSACRTVHVWGRTQEELDAFTGEMRREGFDVTGWLDPEPVARRCNLLVTVTPSRQPLLKAEWLQDDTHITAVGADTPGKQELDPVIVARSHTVVADSLEQCRRYGEISHALREGLRAPAAVQELGMLLAQPSWQRPQGGWSVLDLTGLAVQDAQIASCVLQS
jgi:ornithine cyclodeaminase